MRFSHPTDRTMFLNCEGTNGGTEYEKQYKIDKHLVSCAIRDKLRGTLVCAGIVR